MNSKQLMDILKGLDLTYTVEFADGSPIISAVVIDGVLCLSDEKQEYSFGELSSDAQDKAVNDYIDGWKETHPFYRLRYSEAIELCAESDVTYDVKGNVL